jgi:hypothetical protein
LGIKNLSNDETFFYDPQCNAITLEKSRKLKKSREAQKSPEESWKVHKKKGPKKSKKVPKSLKKSQKVPKKSQKSSKKILKKVKKKLEKSPKKSPQKLQNKSKIFPIYIFISFWLFDGDWTHPLCPALLLPYHYCYYLRFARSAHYFASAQKNEKILELEGRGDPSFPNKEEMKIS